MISRRLLIAAAAGTAIAFSAGLAAAQTVVGVTDTEIKIGNTNPYSGPASAYGTIGKGIKAYFAMINDQGGINGRKINFISLDDGYSPPKTVEQIRRLVEQEKVAFLFQTLGTPTNSAIHKYVNKKKVPHLFVATGATKWGQPKKFPWTMGWQPNYQGEGKIYAQYILDNLPNAKVGILYQNDDYGKDYVKGLVDQLGAKASSIVISKLPYETSDPTVDSQIVSLKNAGANILYNVTTPKFAAQAIRKAADIGWKHTQFLNSVSNSVGSVLKPAGLDKSKGIISAFYLKDPTDPQWVNDADYKAWTAWMDKYYPSGDKLSSFNAYAYAVAATVTQVLKQAGNDLSRENIMKQAANLSNLTVPMLLPGIKINTGANDFYPIEGMELGRFTGEKWELFGGVIDPSKGS